MKPDDKFKQNLALIVTGVLLLAAVLNFSEVLGIVNLCVGLCMPLIVGGAMAFIMNVPMSFFERQIDRLQRRSYSKIIAKARTPLCMIVTLAVFVLAIFFIGRVIFPNLAQAVRGIAAVSYTHLDVYKRQAYHLAVADLGFDILNVKIKIVKVDLDPGRS